jgi:hypothetical protein
VAASASVQRNYRTILARLFSRDLAPAEVLASVAVFKIGEGGHIAGVPKTPDVTLIDLESEGEVKTGLATFTNLSTAVVGDGSCTFIADFAVNDWIKPGARTTGAPAASAYAPGYPGTEYDEWGQVQSITDNNNLVLTAPYAGATTPQARRPKKATAAQGPLYTFRKALGSADVAFFSAVPAIVEVTATVGGAEGNLDQLGNPANYYELGLFDSNGVMVAYMTFDLQAKVVGVQLVNIMDLVY